MQEYNIKEIKRYLEQQKDAGGNSLQTAIDSLSEYSLDRANETIGFTLRDILRDGNDWEDFCEKYGVNTYAVSEGGGHTVWQVYVSDVKKYGLL